MKRLILHPLFALLPLIVGGVGVLYPHSGKAQPLAPPAAIEVTADQNFEWDRRQGRVTARGNAVVKRGQDTVAAPEIVANLKSGTTQDIESLVATGGAVLTSGDGTATGDTLTYDMAAEIAVLTGGDLRLTSPDQIVTARESLTYDRRANRLTAIGQAVVVRGTDALAADKIIATFAPATATGQTTGRLQNAEAVGRVVVTTPTEQMTADKARFDAASNKIYVEGQVKIIRDKNILEGARGEMDLTTQQSILYAAADKKTRVRGVFYSAE